MKILVLNGSPKKKSDTMHLTNAFLEGMGRHSQNEVTVVNVIEKDVRPCRGCFSCMYSGEVRCVQRDDMEQILMLILESQLIIWSFPLYCYGMPSHIKAVCDRLLPFNRMTMQAEEERVSHVGKGEGEHGKHIMICGCGFPAFEGNFAPAVMQFHNCFGEDALTICVSEAPMFNVLEAAALTVPFLEKVKAAGEQFAVGGKISEETMRELDTPMMPVEAYIARVNG